MLNAGYLEIAYDQGNSLKLTAQSHEVLFQGKSVSLYRQLAAKSRTQRVEAQSRPKSKRMQLIEDLFEQLRDLRKNLASNAGIAPYLVFSDATLKEMAAERPTTEIAFRDISGVGEAKFRQYGHVFVEEIMRFILEKRADGSNIQGSTYLETFSLYRRGLSPEDMAQTRKLATQTIYSHLGVLYEQGYAVQLERYISEQEREAVAKAMGLTDSDKVNDLFEYLEGLVPYDKIRLGVSYWRKKQQDQASA
jgi:ATP-dependent DNA helicase RecQ